MPVDKEIDLDDPDGITEEDIQRMNEEADKLKDIAEQSEKNVETIKKNIKVLEGQNFKIIDALTGKVGEAQGAIFDQTAINEIVINILAEQEKAKKRDEEEKSEIDKIKEEQKKAEQERKKLEAQIKNEIHGAENSIDQFLGATSNPLAFGQGKLMGYIGKAGIIGAIVTTVYGIAQTLWNEYMKSFKAGGANDVRKLMDDRDKEMAELNDIIARRSGRVFFTGDIDLRQGAPQFSNTERLRDQVVRYQALHLGE